MWLRHLILRYYYCSLVVPLLLSHTYFTLSHSPSHSHRTTPLSPPTQLSLLLHLNPLSSYTSTLSPTPRPFLPLPLNPLSYTSTLSPLTPQPSLLSLSPLAPQPSLLLFYRVRDQIVADGFTTPLDWQKSGKLKLKKSTVL